MNNLFRGSLSDEALAIHERLLPVRPSKIEGLDCDYISTPAKGNLLADFCDLVTPGANRLVAGVGTLTSKGVAGSILLTGIQTTFHALATRGAGVDDVSDELNQTLWHIAPDNTVASLFVASIDPVRRQVEYVNAGHEAALVVRSQGRIDSLDPNAPVLGLSLRSRYQSRTTRFEPGDTLVAITEGAGDAACKVLSVAPPQRVRDLAALIVDTAKATADRTAVVVHFRREQRARIPDLRMAVAA